MTTFRKLGPNSPVSIHGRLFHRSDIYRSLYVNYQKHKISTSWGLAVLLFSGKLSLFKCVVWKYFLLAIWDETYLCSHNCCPIGSVILFVYPQALSFWSIFTQQSDDLQMFLLPAYVTFWIFTPYKKLLGLEKYRGPRLSGSLQYTRNHFRIMPSCIDIWKIFNFFLLLIWVY